MITMTEKDTVAFLESNLLCFVSPINYDITKPHIVDNDNVRFTISYKPNLPEFFELFIVKYNIVASPELRRDEILIDLVIPIFFDTEFVHTAHVRMMFHAVAHNRAKITSIVLDPVMRDFSV